MSLCWQHLAMTLLCIVAGYLCGAIPFGLLAGKLKGVDIRTCGSGNIGATNAGRVLGRGWGISVFVLDVLKGLLPVALFGQLLGRWGMLGQAQAVEPIGCVLWLVVATACIIGHMFPVYLKFKGGKGVATSLGAVLGIYPYFTLAGLSALAVWAVFTAITRYVSVGSVVAAVAFPIIFGGFVVKQAGRWGTLQQLWPMGVFAVTIAVLVVYRHRGNLKRLWQGTESRIGTSNPSVK